MILSIDVGLKNMSFCKLDMIAGRPEIVEWKLVEVDSPTAAGITLALDCHKELLDGVTVVLVEKQMRNNYKMSFLAHAIEMYVYARALWMDMNEVQIVRCPAFVRCRQLGYVKGNGTKSQEYKRRKNAAIAFTKANVSEKWLTYLNMFKKQDDLCDAFCQGYLYKTKQNL